MIARGEVINSCVLSVRRRITNMQLWVMAHRALHQQQAVTNQGGGEDPPRPGWPNHSRRATVVVVTLVPVKPPSPPSALRATGILFPPLAVVIASPFTIIGAEIFLETRSPDDALVPLPTLLALLSLPGYLYAVVRWSPIRSLSRPKQWWIRSSFVAALLASLLGTLVSLTLVLPAAFAFATVWIIVTIWTRLERTPVTRDSPTHAA